MSVISVRRFRFDHLLTLAKITKVLCDRCQQTIFWNGKNAFCSGNTSVTAETKSNVSILENKREKPSFAKNLFLGVFDKDILVFPEYLELEKLKKLDDKVLLIKSIIEGSKNKPDSKKMNNLLHSITNELSDNTGLSTTEFLKLNEALELQPSLALEMEIQRLVAFTLEKYGSVSQKSKYYSKVISGELQGAYAFCEDVSGSDPMSLKTFVTKNDVGDLTLNGQKMWVTNIDRCDFLLILVKNTVENKMYNSDELSLLLLDKNRPGISFEKVEMNGMKETEFFLVNLKDVVVTEDDMIGDFGKGLEIAVAHFATPKLILCSSILHSMKISFGKASDFIKHRKQCAINLRDCEMIKKKLGKIATNIYAFESMLYLMVGWTDTYTTDTLLENVVIEVFGKEKGLEVVDECILLLGARAFDSSHGLVKLREDLLGLSMGLQTIDLQKMFISSHGLKYAGLNIFNTIKKMRNPFNFPGYALNKLVSLNRQSRDSPKLNLCLYTELHPALREAVDLLEYSALRFQFAVEALLTNHGAETPQRQTELERISDVVTDICAMTSVLGRSSRSYCTGISLCDDEMLLARAFCQETAPRIKKNVDDIIGGAVSSNDMLYLKLSSPIIQKSGYFPEHPLMRNIV